MHGNSQVAAWSTATIAGVSLDKSLPHGTINHAELVKECRERTQSIIHAKGSTAFGIGSVVCSICSSILLDKRNVRPVSHLQPEFGCCFSLPVILGRKGIIRTIQLPLNSEEQAAVAESANTLGATIERINEDQ